MNLHNIEYFLAITEENNISRAAERLHVSQQSLSEQLKKLEAELGVVLINRSQPMTLTPAGEIFQKFSTETLSSYNTMLDEIETIYDKERLMITLAIPSTDTPPFLPGLLSAFSQSVPEVKVKLMKLIPKDSAKLSGDFDLYFSTLPLSDSLENIVVLDSETYAVALSENLAEQVYGNDWSNIEKRLLEEKDLSILRQLPFITLLNHINEIVLDQHIIFKESSFTPVISFQSENNELNAKMCRLGTGAYVATMDCCRRIFSDATSGNEKVHIYPINSSINPVAIALSHRKGKHLTKADRKFINFSKEYLSSTV